jgi:hypothetical protein
MDELKWLIQVASASLTLLMLVEQGRKRGWI